MTKEALSLRVAADIVLFGDWSLFAHDDATKTCREFTLEAIGQTSNGYAPKQRRGDRCRSRR
jgi:hypothetical protein